MGENGKKIENDIEDQEKDRKKNVQLAWQSCLNTILELDDQLSEEIEQWQSEAIEKFDLLKRDVEPDN